MEVAHPQAYALVGMATTLASACSVPLTSVLLLFNMTKSYYILLSLMGAVGLAFWVASAANKSKENRSADTQPSHAYSALTNNAVERNGPCIISKSVDFKEVELGEVEKGSGPAVIIGDDFLHDMKVSEAMSTNFLKVFVSATLKETMQLMLESGQNCVLVVSKEDILEGIMILGDLQ